MATFGFRLRFYIHGPFLDTQETSLELKLSDGHIVTLQPADSEVPLCDANEVIIRGTGFVSREDAQRCGERLRSAIKKSSVDLGMGFDTGRDVATSSAAQFIRDSARAQGYQLLDDVHGLQVFEEDLPARVLRMRGHGKVLTPLSKVLDNWSRHYAEAAVLNQREVLALELYSLAHKEPFMRAKFLTLVTVVEVLAHPSRSGPIGSACRNYVRRVLGDAAARQFKHFYDIRSDITHEGTARAGTDLGVEVAKLDTLVANLLERVGRRQSE